MDRKNQIQKSVRDLDALEKFIKSDGISNPPDTPGGRLIRQAKEELVACSNAKIPDIHKMLIAEFTVGCIMTARSAMCTIIQCRRPYASAKQINVLRDSALMKATKIYFQAIKAADDGLRRLNVDISDGDAQSFEELLADLRAKHKKVPEVTTVEGTLVEEEDGKEEPDDNSQDN